MRADIGNLLHRFFEQHLKLERGMRLATIHSYRDTLRLYLNFTAEQAHRRITRLTLADLTPEGVRAFLTHLEHERGNGVSTRNQRLAALRTFFAFVASEHPETLHQAQRITNIAMKRTPLPGTHYLERDQIDALFAGLPTSGQLALRDHALLLFLYNTGARAQEAADLRARDLHLEEPARALLHGKGGKHRCTPLWPRTASLLSQLLNTRPQPPSPDQPAFASRRGTPLTRFGIHKLVRRHTRNLPRSLGHDRQSISPHVIRHTTAVHLLEAGVELNVIRAWLGHASIDTTNRYAEITTRTKEAALEASLPPTSNTFPHKPIWRDDQHLLDWLQSL